MPFSIRPFRRSPVQCPVTYNACLPKLSLAFCSGFWLLITLLVLSSGPAYAEWVKLGKSDDGTMTAYYDPDTIRHKEKFRKMWLLYDFTIPQTQGFYSYSSVLSQQEYDCAEERHRILAQTAYAGKMRSGSIAFTTSEDKWTPVPPGTFNQFALTLVCSKR